MLSLFIPMILVLDIVNQTEKKRFMEGKGNIFKELCGNISSMRKLICRFGNNVVDEENYQIGFEKIYNLYECTFTRNKIYDGALEVSRELKERCIQICNGN